MVSKGEITEIVESIEYPILKALSHLAVSGLDIQNVNKTNRNDDKDILVGKLIRLSTEEGSYKSPISSLRFQYAVCADNSVMIYFKINNADEVKKQLHLRDVKPFIDKLSDDISNYLKRYDNFVTKLNDEDVENDNFKDFTSSDRAKGYLKCSRLVETFKSISYIEIFTSCDGYVNLKYPKGYWDRFDKNDYDSNLSTFYIDLDTLSAYDGFVKPDNELKYKGTGNGTFESNISCVKKVMLSYPVHFVKND